MAGDGKITLYFAVSICFTVGKTIDYSFPLGMIFWPILPVGGDPNGSLRKGFNNLIFLI